MLQNYYITITLLSKKHTTNIKPGAGGNLPVETSH